MASLRQQLRGSATFIPNLGEQIESIYCTEQMEGQVHNKWKGFNSELEDIMRPSSYPLNYFTGNRICENAPIPSYWVALGLLRY